MSFQRSLRVCSYLIGRHGFSVRATSSSSTSQRCAPVTHLKESYIHCPSNLQMSSETLGQVIDRAAVDFGSTEAVVFVHQNIRRTWLEIKQEADRLAHGFLSLGLERGDRIGIWATNLYEWQLTQYAAAKAGLALVNVNQAYQTKELEYCLKKAGIRTLVAADGYATSNYYSMLTELLPELAEGEPNVPKSLKSERLPMLRDVVMITENRNRGVLRFDDLLDASKESVSNELERRQAQVDCDDVCSIQFTSGTTGLPKGAALTHHNMINNVRGFGRRVGYDVGGERICMSVPLYHCFGCVGGSILAPQFGNTMVFPSAVFNGLASIQATEKERCTIMYGTPTMFVDMVNLPQLKDYDVSSLHGGLTAGAPVPYHLMEAMIKVLGLRDAVVAYGLTEASPLLSVGFPGDDLEHRCGTVGYPLDHVEVKIVDAEGRVVPPGTPGELCSRGYNTMLGYWEDEDKTKATITSSRWLLSGDTAVLTEDGYVKIVGRSKDMVIRGGENIYPVEIEDFLMAHPDILEAYAFGVPDDRMGEEVCVWIRTREPDCLTEKDIRSFCKGKLSHFKIPRYIQFRDDFPKTVTGKIQKFVMRQMMAKELGIEV